MKPISKKQIIIIAFLLVFFIRSVQEYKFQSDMYQFQLEVSEQQLKTSQMEQKVLEYLFQMSNFLQKLLEENTTDL